MLYFIMKIRTSGRNGTKTHYEGQPKIEQARQKAK
jgi:hypothetical protein